MRLSLLVVNTSFRVANSFSILLSFINRILNVFLQRYAIKNALCTLDSSGPELTVREITTELQGLFHERLNRLNVVKSVYQTVYYLTAITSTVN
jgi:hypothetical protein